MTVASVGTRHVGDAFLRNPAPPKPVCMCLPLRWSIASEVPTPATKDRATENCYSPPKRLWILHLIHHAVRIDDPALNQCQYYFSHLIDARVRNPALLQHLHIPHK